MNNNEILMLNNEIKTYERTNKKFSYSSHHYGNSVELHQLTVHEIHCRKKSMLPSQRKRTGLQVQYIRQIILISYIKFKILKYAKMYCYFDHECHNR